MIQELLGGAAAAGLKGHPGERKFSIGAVLDPSSPSLSPSPSPSSITTNNTATNPSSSSNGNNNSNSSGESQNLRCPRCDSTNTKFCYYNNYNLTQPRHFCKTCRRYWTKGGALRNVPIGGGCRKNKNTNVATSSVGKSASVAGTLKTSVPSEISKSGLIGGLEHEISLKSGTGGFWPWPQNSHLLSLLRTAPNPNSNPISNSIAVATGSSHMGSELAVLSGGLSARTVASDPASTHVPSVGFCRSFWGSNHQPHPQNHENHHHHNHHHQQQQQQNSFLLQGEMQSSNGLHELYQRLRSSVNYYTDHHAPAVLTNLASSSSSSPTILESAPVTSAEYWNNPSLSWSDLPTTNGAYP